MVEKRYCIVCGTDITEKRADAKTCSGGCRQKAKRFRDDLYRQTVIALDALYYVGQTVANEAFGEIASEYIDALVGYARQVHADVTMHQEPRGWWKSGV